MRKRTKKLVLNKETRNVLTSSDLANAHGGTWLLKLPRLNTFTGRLIPRITSFFQEETYCDLPPG